LTYYFWIYRVASGDHLLARLRFRHLQLIVEVERTGSLSRAAEALSLSQPALSKSLKEIEGMLNFEIFHRGPRGLQKTPQGALVIQGASLLLRELQHVRAEAEAAGANAGIAAVLRLGTSAFIAVSLLLPIIAQLTGKVPPVAVRVREDSVPRLFEYLHAGRLDALVTLYDSNLGNRSGRALRKYFGGSLRRDCTGRAPAGAGPRGELGRAGPLPLGAHSEAFAGAGLR
jgi:LysR family transcriptional regulator of abg operon